MDFKQIQLFDMARKKMRYLTQRQDVLAQNIANADTPDYRPKDLVPLDFNRTLRQQFHRLQPTAPSSGAYIKGTLPLDPKFRNPEVDKVYETSPDGNAVVIEEQLMKVNDTQLQYKTATDLYRKYNRMFKTAIGRRGQ